MKVYPSSTEEFTSPLLPLELIARVQQNTTNRVFEWREEAFRGTVDAASFSLRRIRWFNNVSNRPNVEGHVELLPEGKGSKLTLRFSLNPFGFWAGAAIAFLICGFGMLLAVTTVIDGDTSPVVLLMPPSVFFLAIFSITGPFWQEVRSFREVLIELLSLSKE